MKIEGLTLEEGGAILKILSPTHGEFEVLIDQEDYDRVVDYGTWYINIAPSNSNPYVVCKKRQGHKIVAVKLHRFITDAPPRTPVDHINGNPLDNRKSNLRVCDHSKNAVNRPPGDGWSSKYKGVSWVPKANKWVAQIRKGSKNYFIGYFESEHQAALAFNSAAEDMFGDFALLNYVPKEFRDENKGA